MEFTGTKILGFAENFLRGADVETLIGICEGENNFGFKIGFHKV
jgi:hypothetical protein